MSYQALLLDLSGVLYEASRPIPGAADIVSQARRRGLVVRFVTNTATQSHAEVLTKLEALHIPVRPEELYTAPLAARAFIEERRWRPYCLVHPAIEAEFTSLDTTDPNCVLLGDARDKLNYAAMNRAFRLCMAGAPLIGIGMNRYFRDDDGLKLDAGPFIRAIEWAAGIEAIVMGKPSRAFFNQIVASTGVPAAECLMVGDDVEGDVEGALQAGLQGCLVQTGKYRAGDEKRLPASARLIASVADLLDDP